MEAMDAQQQAPSSTPSFRTTQTSIDSEVTLVDDSGPPRWSHAAAVPLAGGVPGADAAAPSSSAAPAQAGPTAQQTPVN